MTNRDLAIARAAELEEKLCLSKCNDHNCVVSGTCLGECGRYRREST